MSATLRTTGRRSWRTLALVLAAAVGLITVSACAGSGSGGGGDVVELKLADYQPKSDYHTKHGLQVFMDEAEKLSDGTLEFEHYPAEQLASAEDMLDSTESGLADISLLGVPYHSDKLPLAGVCALPGAVTTVKQGTEACWKVTRGSHVQKEYLDNGVRPLYTHVNEPYGVQTAGTKVETLEDMKGLKLRSNGGDMSKLLARVGATPVELTGPETYEGVERGTLDGTLYPVLSLEPYELEKPLDYGVTGVNLGGFLHTAVINQDAWSDLTAKQKDALMQAGKRTMKTYATWVDDNAADATKELENDGEVDFYELPPAEVKRWNAEATAVSQRWASSMEADGLPGKQVWQAWNDALAK